MSVKIESTTDTPEQITAALGGLKEETAVETKKEVETENKSASDKESDETREASDASKDDEGQEVDSQEDENEDDGESSDEEKPKKKFRGYKRRNQKLNARISEYERELAQLRAGATQKTQETPEPTKTAMSAGQPDPDNFETFADYTKALVKWERDQEREAERKEKAKEEYTNRVNEHNKRVSQYAKENPAFKESIQSALDVLGEDFRLSETLEDEVLSSEMSHLILEELAQDLDEFERINALPANKVAREIGKIEARLTYSKPQKTTGEETKKITKAPPPLKTLGNKSTGASTKSPDEMDFREYKKWREANL